MKHNITIKGQAVEIDYSIELIESEVQNARKTGNGIPNTSKITITKGVDFFEVFDLITFGANFNRGDLEIFYNHYNILPDKGVKDLGSKKRGITVQEFTQFMSIVFGTTLTHLATTNSVNMILQNAFGDGDYKCHAFNEQTLEPIQPLLFDIVQNNGAIAINVTDSTGECTYSLDGETWQESNEFSSLESGNYTIYVKDSTDYINRKKTTIDFL